MIADAINSFAQIFSPPFRRVMWKSLGLTTAILVLAGIGLDRLALSLVHVGPAWLSAVLSIVVALGLVAGMIFLAPPTASLVASFFLDDIAAIVERAIDPYGLPGRPLPIAPSAVMGLRFAVLSVLVNVVVLLLTIFTGIGVASFFILNGYLLGARVFRACGDAPWFRRSGPAPFPSALGAGVARGRDRLGRRRRAGCEPVDAAVRDSVDDPRVQAGLMIAAAAG